MSKTAADNPAPIIVIAGTFMQFQEWCWEFNLTLGTDAIFADDDSILGYSGNRIERIGTWRNNPVSFNPRVQGKLYI